MMSAMAAEYKIVFVQQKRFADCIGLFSDGQMRRARVAEFMLTVHAQNLDRMQHFLKRSDHVHVVVDCFQLLRRERALRQFLLERLLVDVHRNICKR